jgi:hypothetical protein
MARTLPGSCILISLNCCEFVQHPLARRNEYGQIASGGLILHFFLEGSESPDGFVASLRAHSFFDRVHSLRATRFLGVVIEVAAGEGIEHARRGWGTATHNINVGLILLTPSAAHVVLVCEKFGSD